MGLEWRYLVRRVLYSIPVFVAATLISYFVAVTAGNHFWDVANQLAQAHYQITPQQFVQLQSYYHIDQPVFEGYFFWLTGVVRGDLGLSITGQPVANMVVPWILPTLELQVPAILTSVTIGLVIGIYAGSRRDSKADSAITLSSVLGVALPAFWLSTVAILIVSLRFHLLPASGIVSGYPPFWWGSPVTDQVAHWIMPFSILVLVSTPLYVKIARASTIDALSKEWVTALRVSGLPERTILYRYVLRSALGPVLAVLGLNLGVFLAASPGIEVAFAWPGLGRGLVTAAQGFDQPVEIAIILLMTLITIAAGILADFAHAHFDPRVTLD